MATPRLPRLPHDVSFGLGDEPNHRRYAIALSRVLYGRAAELARVGRWSERMLQYWMEAQSRHASPPEQLRDLLLDMRRIGADGWAEILDMVCCDLGGRFVVDEQPAEQADAPRAADAADMMAELADVVRAHAECLDGVTPEEADRFEREYRELEAVMRLARLKVQAAAGRATAKPRKLGLAS